MLLSGEGGIGKSRLSAALMEHLAGETHTRLRYFWLGASKDMVFVGAPLASLAG